jgi:3D (Asp-Asp-Asp) domain-containing protein
MIKLISFSSFLLSGLILTANPASESEPQMQQAQFVYGPTNPSSYPTYPEIIYSDQVNYETYMDNPPKKEYISYGGVKYEKVSENKFIRDGYYWKKMKVDATAYTWKDDPPDPSLGNGKGKTAKGTDAIKTKGFAADPRVFRYGTVIHLENYGTHTVDDTGGALRKAYRRKQDPLIDVRITQVQNGKWLSVNDMQAIARKFGRKNDIEIMIRLEKIKN